MPCLDAIVCGSVAVTRDGRRCGKGEGYSDLEFAILRELGAKGPASPGVAEEQDAIKIAEKPTAICQDLEIMRPDHVRHGVCPQHDERAFDALDETSIVTRNPFLRCRHLRRDRLVRERDRRCESASAGQSRHNLRATGAVGRRRLGEANITAISP